MNDLYAYPIAIIVLFFTWIALFKLRKDLRKKMILSGVAMVPTTLLEYWCKRDYWNPPGPYFLEYISIENILFFFFTTSISVSIYDVLFQKKNVKIKKRKTALLYIYIISIILSLFFFTDYLQINSILVICAVTFLFTITMLFFRKDLLIPCLITGFIITLYAIVLYHFLFNVLFTQYWDKYWLLNNTAIGIKVFGNIPVTELLWYFTWSCFCSVAYNFSGGHIKEDLKVKN